jgi:RNA polymerase sigma factor (sigma-70 family)
MERLPFTTEEIRLQDARLRRLARRLGANGEAEDVVQEAWLAALRRPPKEEENVQGWLYTVMRFASFRHRRRERERWMRESLVARSQSQFDDVQEIREPGPTALAAELAALREPYRTVIRLRYFDELSIEEISVRLGRPEATVKSQLQRGVGTLRRRLGPSRVGMPSLLVRAAERLRTGGEALASGKLLPIGVVSCACLALFFVVRAVDQRVVADEAPVSVALEGRTTAPALPVEALAPSASRRPAVLDPGSLVVSVEWADAGGPVADAPVFLAHESLTPGASERREARTDPSGRARFEELLPGPWRIGLQLGGGSFAVVEPGRERTVRLALPRGIEITGTVELRRVPLPDAEIWVSLPDRTDVGSVVARTDAEGRFRLHDVDPRSWIGALHEDAIPPMLIPLDAPRAEGDLRLSVREGKGSLRGRILDEDGAPLAGVRVRCLETRDELRPGWSTRMPSVAASTDEGGSFELPVLSPAATLLVLEADGFEPQCLRLPNAGQIVLPPAISMQRSLRIEGRIVDEGGAPQAGASIALEPGEPFSALLARSDAAGGYAFASVGRRLYRLRAASADGTRSSVQELDLRSSPSNVVVAPLLVLDERSSLCGRAEDEHGEPLVGWIVELVEERAARGAEPLVGRPGRQPRSTATGERGEFTFGACDGGPYLLRLLPAGGGAPRACEAGARPGPGSHVLIASAAPTAAFRGILAPVGVEIAPGTRMLLASPDLERPLRAAVEPTDGAFSFEDVPPGSYDLLVWSPDLEPMRLRSVEVLAGEELPPESFELSRPGSVTGQLRFSDGFPREKQGVEIRSDRMSRTGFMGRNSAVRIDATGSYRCDDLVPGVYAAYLFSNATILDCRDVEVAAGATTSLDLAANEGALVEVVAAYAGLLPDSSRFSLEIREDASGEFCVRRALESDHAGEPLELRWIAPPGAYRARLTSDVGIEGSAEFVVGSEQELRVEVELVEASGARIPPAEPLPR